MPKASRKRAAPTRGDDVIEFIETFCRAPEGMHVGKPIILDYFQKDWIHATYDNPAGTRRSILSVAKKNGKSTLVAGLLLAHLDGPEAVFNSQIVSGAMAKEQAALIHKAACKMIELEPDFHGRFHIVPSSKVIIGLTANAEYRALAADGRNTQGISPILALLDETGQVVGPSHPFVDAIVTSQGAHANPLLLVISTQAPSDTDLLSMWIDDALRGGDPHTVCHLHAAPEGCDLLDQAAWAAANPGLGTFRNRDDLRVQLEEAARLPSREAACRNLLLNQRIALEKLWLAPTPWRECSGAPDVALFNAVKNGGRRVAVGLDLSARHDLTAAVAAVADNAGVVHLLPFVFTPMSTMLAREISDRAPYTQWVREGHLIAVPGATVDFPYVCGFLRDRFAELGIEPGVICYDRWRILDFKKAADAESFATDAEWKPVGQGFRDMSPRMESFEALLLGAKLRHGAHPLLNRAAASAIAISDPRNNHALDKSLSTQRIDPLVAAVMAAHEVSEGAEPEIDIDAWLG